MCHCHKRLDLINNGIRLMRKAGFEKNDISHVGPHFTYSFPEDTTYAVLFTYTVFINYSNIYQNCQEPFFWS